MCMCMRAELLCRRVVVRSARLVNHLGSKMSTTTEARIDPYKPDVIGNTNYNTMCIISTCYRNITIRTMP